MTVAKTSSQGYSIVKVRRHYNQWVADQMLEDFALRFTAHRARRMSISTVGKTALGATAFLALESIAAAVTLSYGFINSVVAMVVVCAILFITGLPISYYSARYGLDIDLLTRGAGFGYLGSTITSLIYAAFTFIFFAIEAAILSSALNLLFGIPMPLAYVFCAVAVIPIVTRGISAISKFQVGTQGIWLILQIVALAVVIVNEWGEFQAWTQFEPVQQQPAAEFSWVLFGAAASVLFAMIAQIGEQVDYLRFVPEKNEANKRQWWFWVVLSGPGWVSVGLVKMLLGSFLAFIAIKQGLSFAEASDPTRMYQRAFNYFLNSEQIALIFAAVMVIISQMKINVTNAYAGSIAWSNFFSRLTHSHPGRVVWLVFNVTLALILMELGIHRALEAILSVFAFVAVSWLCCVSADLLINKPLGLSPKGIEFKRGYLHDFNPVGAVSIVLATSTGLFCYLGVFGDGVKTLGHFFSIAVCFISVPAIAWITKGKYYLARTPQPLNETDGEKYPEHQCGICLNAYEKEDVLFCPAYGQNICSLCCSLDVRCLDQCRKPKKSNHENADSDVVFRVTSRVVVTKRLLNFFMWFAISGTATSALMALLYQSMRLRFEQSLPEVVTAFATLFIVLMIVFGVVIWLFLLAQESRQVAQQESNRQTHKLMEEIEAHQETDLKLQEAKDLAERANAAKSRYLSGISHELRTPLQSILGYAQLLVQREETPGEMRHGLNAINRSGQYLADLIEGLLDVSKIEAGRLDLHYNQFSLQGMIEQVFDMFEVPAHEKNLLFHLHIHDALPAQVNADEKRVRQVLINLLSNAIKYTEQGRVDFHVRYRNQVAEFEIVDTGVGIAPSAQERVFSPFERLQSTTEYVTGTGLGLTIVKLLVEVMGGDIKLESTPGAGTSFKVSLMLPWVHASEHRVETHRSIVGYEGERKTLCLVDDDPVVRGLVVDLLRPLGFECQQYVSAEQCLGQFGQHAFDLYLLDVSLPGASGLQLAKELRDRGCQQTIVMLSANAQVPTQDQKPLFAFDDYLVKPVSTTTLLDVVGKHLQLTWRTNRPEVKPAIEVIRIPKTQLLELQGALEIGYKKGIESAIENLHEGGDITLAEFQYLQALAQQVQFRAIEKLVGIKNL